MRKTRCSSVKGHLTNKSTAFSPNGAKFGQQALIHDHMMNHYRLIDKAKSSIDNKPPKSINLFIKAKQKKAQSNKIVYRTAFQEGKHNISTSQTNKEADLSSPNNQYHEADARQIEESFLLGQREDVISPIESFTNIRSRTVPCYKNDHGNLIKRSSTPKYKIEMYAPETGPPLLKGSMYNKHISPEKSSHDLIGYSNDLKHEKSAISRPLDPKIAWSNGTVSYREPRYTKSVRLDMSLMSLNEQLNHTQSLNKFTNKEIPEYEVDRLQKQEELIAEEQLYLQFIEEVTTDIITRGIFSDRVLNQVFDAHLEKRRGYLNEGRMQAMIEELKRDLNVEDEDSRNSLHDVISYKGKNNRTSNDRHNNALTKNQYTKRKIEDLVEESLFDEKDFSRDDRSGVEDNNILGTISKDQLSGAQLSNFNNEGYGMIKDHNNNDNYRDLGMTTDDVFSSVQNIQDKVWNGMNEEEGEYSGTGGNFAIHEKVGESSGNSGDGGGGGIVYDDFTAGDEMFGNEFDGDHDENEAGDEYDEEF